MAGNHCRPVWPWIAACAVLVAAAVAAGLLYGSLPSRDGVVAIDGLRAPVEVAFDRHAVPGIEGESFEDVLRAQGFLHGQERFFQMDLVRRAVAGELSALFGERALPLDREARLMQLRRRARALAMRLPDRHRDWLHAYAEGVNAGLDELGARPPEYWLLRTRPVEWTLEDSLLVVYYFCTLLSTNYEMEQPQASMQAALPAALYEFLTPSTSRFDRPLILTDPEDPTGGYRPAPLPPPAVVDLRGAPRRDAGRPLVDPPLLGPASNQWAVGAARTADGAAMLANDPHLRIRLPGVFYRSELHWPGHVARGLGIPGVPGILLGATSRLAWGATVSNADQSDWVVVDLDPTDPSRYRVADGWAQIGVAIEEIEVRGHDDVERVEVRSTRWGPILDSDWRGRPLALRATWLDPDGVDLGILELPFAEDVAAGIDVLQRWAGPSQNWMLADSAGRVGWTLNGPLPRRSGFDGSVPRSWADTGVGWSGYAAPPALTGDRTAMLFTANNRTLPAEAAAELSRMWMRPTRARRIDELLRRQVSYTPADFLAMQLDTQAAAYDAIRTLLLEIVPAGEQDPGLGTARRHVVAWNGHADVDQVGFRLLHVYYLALIERVLAPLLAPVLEIDPGFVYRWPLADESLRRLLEERPAHLLDPRFDTWPAFLRDVLADALAALASDPLRPSPEAPWGRVNRLDVAHAMGGVPLLGRWLRLPDVPLPGSMVSLRVAAPGYGAAVRLVVAPARPQHGILQMPGGQSGHWLSPNFDDLTADWLDGTPTPFVAGPPVSRLTLRPAR